MATKNSKKKEPKTVTFASMDKCKLLDLSFRELVRLVEPEVKWIVLNELSGDKRFCDKCPMQIIVESIGTHSQDEIELPEDAPEPDWDKDPFTSTVEVRGRIEYWSRSNQPDLKFKTWFGNVNGTSEIDVCEYRVFVAYSDGNWTPLEFNICEEDDEDEECEGMES